MNHIPDDHEAPHGSVLSAAAWMVLLTLLLFWLPFVGPMIAGYVGGGRAGSLGRALAAALVPALLFAGLLFAFGMALTGMPLIGAVAGFGGLFLALSCSGALVLGAILGAVL